MISRLYVLADVVNFTRVMDRLDMHFRYVDSVWGKMSYADGSMECFELEPYKLYHYPNGFMLMVVI